MQKNKDLRIRLQRGKMAMPCKWPGVADPFLLNLPPVIIPYCACIYQPCSFLFDCPHFQIGVQSIGIGVQNVKIGVRNTGISVQSPEIPALKLDKVLEKTKQGFLDYASLLSLNLNLNLSSLNSRRTFEARTHL